MEPGRSGLLDTQGSSSVTSAAPSVLPSLALPIPSTVPASSRNLRQSLASSAQSLSTTEMSNVITASSLPSQLPGRPGSDATVQSNPLDFMVPQKVKDKIWAREYVRLNFALVSTKLIWTLVNMIAKHF